jgi:hypothetical protein
MNGSVVLCFVLEHIANHRISDIQELLPWNAASMLTRPRQPRQLSVLRLLSKSQQGAPI